VRYSAGACIGHLPLSHFGIEMQCSENWLWVRCQVEVRNLLFLVRYVEIIRILNVCGSRLDGVVIGLCP
jgi:hypothetical protein